MSTATQPILESVLNDVPELQQNGFPAIDATDATKMAPSWSEAQQQPFYVSLPKTKATVINGLRYYTLKIVADYFHVSTVTLGRAIRAGRIFAIRNPIKKDWLIHESEFVQLVERLKVK